MKRVLTFIVAVITAVIFFYSCGSLFPLDKDQFELGDTVTISIAEKLYENPSLWVRLDSITEDSRCPEGATCVWEGRVVMWFTAGTNSGEQTISFSSDTCMDSCIYYFENLYDSHFSQYSFTIAEILPQRINDDSIPKSDYRVKFVIDNNFDTVRKPNIYLYPEKKTKMIVSLEFPYGGEVTESIPQYPKKWKNIRVKPDGTINRKYEFLFYEADLPDVWQYDSGWVTAQKDLPFFFAMNLRNYGFNKKEIYDFVDYWIPRLKDAPFYGIWPQHTAQIDHVIPLKLSQRADSRLRLFYIIRDMTEYVELKEPNIPPFERKGFVVTEWGVILK